MIKYEVIRSDNYEKRRINAVLQVKIKEYSDNFDVDLMDNSGKPDCNINHFGYNFYFRTNAGMKYKRYKTLKTLFASITNKAKALGLTVQSIGLKGNYYRIILTN